MLDLKPEERQEIQRMEIEAQRRHIDDWQKQLRSNI
jgi:hypothetical protein